MKRIDIFYGGQHYSVGEADLERLQREIVDAAHGGARWLTVNEGEGAPRPAHLLIGPGVPVALVPVPEPPPDDDEPA